MLFELLLCGASASSLFRSESVFDLLGLRTEFREPAPSCFVCVAVLPAAMGREDEDVLGRGGLLSDSTQGVSMARLAMGS